VAIGTLESGVPSASTHVAPSGCAATGAIGALRACHVVPA
jgi:hypothetical protein